MSITTTNPKSIAIPGKIWLVFTGVFAAIAIGCSGTDTATDAVSQVAGETSDQQTQEPEKKNSGKIESGKTDMPQGDKAATSKSAASNPDQDTAEELNFGEVENLLAKDSLDGWEELSFGGEGDCEVKDGVLRMGAGDPMTGIAIDHDDLPKTDYEISLDARKIDGTDFFCCLTFPVAESHCSLIVGGWGGTLVGLSCINDADASTNGTRSIRKFETGQWYSIRVRVQPEKISTWIDDKQVIDQSIVGKKISLRNDVDLSKPLGLSSFQTIAEIKNVQLKRILTVDTKASNDDKSDAKQSDSKESATK